MTTQPEPTTEPETKPIRRATINADYGDMVRVSLVEGFVWLTLDEDPGETITAQFDPKNAPHTVAALKAVMVGIEKDGGEVVR